MTSFMCEAELAAVGFARIGTNVLVSRDARIYGASRIRLGNHVRIDDFVFLSAGAGGFEIGNHVHISIFTSIVGAGTVVLSDFSGVSSRVSVYSSTDDFSGEHLTGPTIPKEYRRVHSASVTLGRHAVIGTGSVVMPGATIGEGAAIGALSLVKSVIPPFEIHAGCPARKIGERKRDLAALEAKLHCEPRFDGTP